jgi:hypothetical protein
MDKGMDGPAASDGIQELTRNGPTGRWFFVGGHPSIPSAAADSMLGYSRIAPTERIFGTNKFVP